jgi:hypothetical protein
VSTLVLILCAPQSLFAYARSKWPTRKSYIIEPSTSKANPSIAGRQNRQNQPGNRKEHFAKRYATKTYLNDATGRWNHFKTEAGIKSDEGSRILCWSQTALFVVRAEHIPRACFTHCALFDQKCAHLSWKYMKKCTPFFHGTCAHNFQRLNSVSFFKFQENFDPKIP